MRRIYKTGGGGPSSFPQKKQTNKKTIAAATSSEAVKIKKKKRAVKITKWSNPSMRPQAPAEGAPSGLRALKSKKKQTNLACVVKQSHISCQ